MFYPISTSYEWFVPVTIYIHYSCWKINLFLFCKKILQYILLIFCKAQLLKKSDCLHIHKFEVSG